MGDDRAVEVVKGDLVDRRARGKQIGDHLDGSRTCLVSLRWRLCAQKGDHGRGASGHLAKAVVVEQQLLDAQRSAVRQA